MSSAADLRAASCSGVGGAALRPPRPVAAVTRLSGSPRNASTGCVRSSTPLTPSVTQCWMISSTGALRPPKLYGTFMPIVTPRTFEFGFA